MNKFENKKNVEDSKNIPKVLLIENQDNIIIKDPRTQRIIGEESKIYAGLLMKCNERMVTEWIINTRERIRRELRLGEMKDLAKVEAIIEKIKREIGREARKKLKKEKIKRLRGKIEDIDNIDDIMEELIIRGMINEEVKNYVKLLETIAFKKNRENIIITYKINRKKRIIKKLGLKGIEEIKIEAIIEKIDKEIDKKIREEGYSILLDKERWGSNQEEYS